MEKDAVQLTMFDFWVSMLENWADSMKEFKRECEKNGLLVGQCMPKMSKNLVRALKAMKRIKSQLPVKIEGNAQFKADLAEVRPHIVGYWYGNIKRKVNRSFFTQYFTNIEIHSFMTAYCRILPTLNRHV